MTDFPTPLVTTDWLAANADAPGVRVFDCTLISRPDPSGVGLAAESGRALYEAGHIPGAAHIDILAISDPGRFRYELPVPDTFADRIGALGIGEGVKAVLYCRNNHNWAARVWNTLRHYGFDDAAVLDGGWTKWSREGRPVESGRRGHPPARFVPRPRDDVFLDKAAVRAALDDTRARLVNALGADQHAGTGGVHYGRPGRLPGSVNVPARSLIDPVSETFLPPDRLRAIFAAAGALDQERIVLYCGGGVAASCDALALALIGREASVYARSLQEWATDPACPMERDP